MGDILISSVSSYIVSDNIMRYVFCVMMFQMKYCYCIIIFVIGPRYLLSVVRRSAVIITPFEKKETPFSFHFLKNK